MTLACTCGRHISLIGQHSECSWLAGLWQQRHSGEGHEPCTLKRAQETLAKKAVARDHH
jgi:hypothetical protein